MYSLLLIIVGKKSVIPIAETDTSDNTYHYRKLYLGTKVLKMLVNVAKQIIKNVPYNIIVSINFFCNRCNRTSLSASYLTDFLAARYTTASSAHTPEFTWLPFDTGHFCTRYKGQHFVVVLK
jgi:hypothetical protein